MDTRQKIVSIEQAEAQRDAWGPLTIVVGYFDPMTAGHARRLGEIHFDDHCLLVIVTAPATPLLSTPARAELLAGLQAVDYVVAALDNTSAEIIARLRPDVVMQEEAADLQRAQELRAHIRARQIAKEA